jgi:hypothetical protein
LQRSAYPDRLDEEILLALIQQLWDRAEPQGYMNHLSAGDLSTPPVPHKVLIHMATYDSEVSNRRHRDHGALARHQAGDAGAPDASSRSRAPRPFDDSAFVEVNPQRKRSATPGGGPKPGPTCTTDATAGAGDPPTHTFCDPTSRRSRTRRRRSTTATTATRARRRWGAQINEFMKPAGNVQQFCAGTCDPN